MTEPLPPLPILPATQEERNRWLWWGKQCYEAGVQAERERAAKVCESIARDTYGMTKLREFGECADAIRTG